MLKKNNKGSFQITQLTKHKQHRLDIYRPHIRQSEYVVRIPVAVIVRHSVLVNAGK